MRMERMVEDLVFAGEFDEDFFEGSEATREGAEGPIFFGGEVAEFESGVGVWGDKDGEAEPAVGEVFAHDLGDFGDLVEEDLSFFVGGLDFEGDATGAAHGVDEVFGGVGGFDFPFVDNDDFVAGHFDFAEDVGGEEDGVLVTELLDESTDGPDLVGIESVGGFVEDEEVGLVDEGIGEANALAVSFGESFDHFASDIAESAGFHDFAEAFAKV